MIISRVQSIPLRVSQSWQWNGNLVPRKVDRLGFPIACLLALSGFSMSVFSLCQMGEEWYRKQIS